MKNRGIIKRIDVDLDRLIREMKELEDETYRSASRKIANQFKKVKLKPPRKDDIIF